MSDPDCLVPMRIPTRLADAELLIDVAPARQLDIGTAVGEIVRICGGSWPPLSTLHPGGLMRPTALSLALVLSALLLAGCQRRYLPPVVEVTELETGEKFTYYEALGKQNMLGLNAWDHKRDTWFMIRTYTGRVVEPGARIREKDDPRWTAYVAEVEEMLAASLGEPEDLEAGNIVREQQPRSR
jgi:hypothetical protein